jgi:hypothetical protein
VIRSGWWVLGSEVAAFEKEWAACLAVPHVVGCGNGMDAIELGLRALGIGAGDEVITTPMTAFATVLAVLRTGATPVLADIDADTELLILDGDPARLARARGILDEVLAIESRPLARSEPSGVAAVAAMGIVGASCVAFGFLALDRTGTAFWWICAAAATAGAGALAWTTIVRPAREQARVEVALRTRGADADGPGDPLGAAEALFAADRVQEGLGVLAGEAIRASRGSPEARPWLEAAAARLTAIGAHGRADRLRKRILTEYPGTATPLTRPAAPVPWRAGALLAIPTGPPAPWPERCPLCNQPGTHAARLPITTSTPVSPALLLLALRVTGGLFVLLLLLSARHTEVVRVWLCEAHARGLGRATWAVRGGTVAAVGCAVAACAGYPLALFGVLAGIVAVLAGLGTRNPFRSTSRDDGIVVIYGAHPGFVRERPPLA